nr:unnamed protein product [Digitaria exilis]
MHTAVFILTALLAATGATRSANIGIVIAIGSLGLVLGWLLEFSTARRFICWSWRINFNVPQSMWHITIYTSSFFFLCSMRVNTRSRSPESNYELTRQDSLPRSEPRETS